MTGMKRLNLQLLPVLWVVRRKKKSNESNEMTLLWVVANIEGGQESDQLAATNS